MSRDISERRKKLLAELGAVGRENSNAVVAFHSTVAARMGLGVTEEKALDVLERHGPLTAGEIVRHMGLAPASVSGLIDRLQEKGFVRRDRHATDRRRVVVQLDHQRVAGFGDLFAGLVAGLAELYEQYSDDELELLLDYLRRTTEVQRAATDHLRS